MIESCWVNLIKKYACFCKIKKNKKLIVYLIKNNCNFEKAKSSSIESRSPFIDFPSPGINYINKLNSPRIIKTHLPIQFLPDNVENESKVIYILRNPKDVCVSYYHFAKMSTEAEYEGNFDHFCELFVQGTGKINKI